MSRKREGGAQRETEEEVRRAIGHVDLNKKDHRIRRSRQTRRRIRGRSERRAA
jgi:hypothetical protein